MCTVVELIVSNSAVQICPNLSRKESVKTDHEFVFEVVVLFAL